MKDKIRFDLSDDERTTIIKALNMLRNHLSMQEQSTIYIDELIIKINDNHKFELDIFDAKIVINALNNMRYKLKNENKPRDDVNNIILKMIDETDSKKKRVLRMTMIGNVRK